MYRKIDALEYKSYFKLPVDYSVEAFIVYGAWDVELYIRELRSTVEISCPNASFKRLDGFLADILEVTYEGRIYWLAVCYGSAKLSEYVHLASIFGSRSNLHLGSCGVLAKDIAASHIILPSDFSSEDESLRLYRSSSKPSEELRTHLRAYLAGRNMEFSTGKSLSIQTMLAETIEDITGWAQEGYISIDMESASVNAVSSFFSVPSASLMYASDNLIYEETVLSDSFVNKTEERRHAKSVILGAIPYLMMNPL